MDTEDNTAVVFCASKTNLMHFLLSRLTSPRSSPLSLWDLERECPKMYVVLWPGADGKDCCFFDCFSLLLPLYPAQVDPLAFFVP